MLIKFSVENWMSFRGKTTFSMIASREQQHKERVSQVNNNKIKLLPIAAIYGGNASGKSNFFKALDFAKKLVVRGTQPDDLIAVDTFCLDTEKLECPANFIFELLIGDNIYEYSFSVTNKAILEEKLIEISETYEKILYNRKEGKPNFDTLLENIDFLKFAFQGTRDNQLFLTNSISQKVENFRPIYNWFKNVLVLIKPDTKFSFSDESHPLYASLNVIIPQLDTGISRLESEEISLDKLLLSIPPSYIAKIQDRLEENGTCMLGNNFVIKKNGTLVTKKLVTYHSQPDGIEKKFDISKESDGSQRAMDLAPAFFELSLPSSNKVYIIDEIDRSLHTLLVRSLLEYFLAGCSVESRSQLIFTTHDVLLMDQKLFRRDEIWVTERDDSGASHLFSFSEYKNIRYDKDIRKSYLQGRLGGIPHILLRR